MAVVLLSFIASDDFISAGVPKEITITTNVPASVYYTLDGSVPTESSPIYVDPIELPKETSVVLSAFAVDGDGYESSVLIQRFAPNNDNILSARRDDDAGLIVDDYEDLANIIYGYNADGEEFSYTDIEDINLYELQSERGYLGLYEGTQIDVLVPDYEDTAHIYDDPIDLYSHTSDKVFNPYATFIVIDERDPNRERIITRPLSPIPEQKKNNIWSVAELRGKDSNYNTGGALRSFYNPVTKLYVSYFYDNRSGRWIKHIQNLNAQPSNGISFNQDGQPLVFKWLPHGRPQAIT